MDEIIAQPAFDRRRGDGSFVSLLFVVAVPLAVAVFALTLAFIAPADTVLDLVPRNAVAYAHASGRPAVTAMLASSIDMPTDVLPDEVARFAAPGDDGLRHAILVAWRAPRLPSAAEVAALQGRGGIMIDERRAVLGDTALGLSVKVASAIGASVADDPRRAAMLARMRSLHAVQGFADAAVIPADALAVAEDANGGPIPGVVFGATVRADRVLARALPLEGGMASGSGATTETAPLRDLGSPIIATEPAPSFDVINILFGNPSIGHPSPEVVDDAAQALEETFRAPYALWLKPEPDGHVGYLFRFPTVRPDEAKSRMATYAAALEPSRSIVELPDGDVAVEFSVVPAPVSSGIAAFGSTDGIGTTYVGEDGRGGTLVGSSAAMFSAHLAAPRLPVDGFCETPSMLVLNAPVPDAPQLNALTEPMLQYGIHRLVIGKTVDNELRLCGYRLSTVDK